MLLGREFRGYLPSPNLQGHLVEDEDEGTHHAATRAHSCASLNSCASEGGHAICSAPSWLAVTQDADTALALRALSNAAKDDVRGIARPDAEAPILPACTYWIGAAFRKWLGSTDPIAVGRDPRLSSEDLSMAFCRGAEACDAGPATTPAMLESLLGPSAVYAGSVFVTASHLPPEWNGLKLFSRQLGRGLNKVG